MRSEPPASAWATQAEPWTSPEPIVTTDGSTATATALQSTSAAWPDSSEVTFFCSAAMASCCDVSCAFSDTSDHHTRNIPATATLALTVDVSSRKNSPSLRETTLHCGPSHY